MKSTKLTYTISVSFYIKVCIFQNVKVIVRRKCTQEWQITFKLLIPLNEISSLQFSCIKIINYIQYKNLAHILVLIIHNPYGAKHVVFYINTNITFMKKHFCRLHYSLVFNLRNKNGLSSVQKI
jgi:hypothetical protein